MTVGEPLFCNHCGRSYDVKLCPRLHQNSRISEVCSQCGSRDLSTPQPKVSVWWKVLSFLLRIVVGTLLVLLSITLLVNLVSMPQMQNVLLGLGILLGLLWWIWSEIPDWLKKVARRVLQRKERKNHD
jgi:hypothetical protein